MVYVVGDLHDPKVIIQGDLHMVCETIRKEIVSFLRWKLGPIYVLEHEGCAPIGKVKAIIDVVSISLTDIDNHNAYSADTWDTARPQGVLTFTPLEQDDVARRDA